MRILAIRGRNLASLAGDFAIDFAAEPLASSGIFAITGPTGAGKSTLLDAVCLALYGDIPRLRAAPTRARIGGDDAIGAGDVRSILRHGTGEGFAEVDFAIPGGATYRARWSVKRARGKADGRLQNADHAFERLDQPERLGGTRTETLAEIHRMIGLSAEQFGRAVLLAQGDFEAFIRADANDRAILLERLTGSGIYTRLGQAAAEKAKVLRERLDIIRQRIADQKGLTDEERAGAEAECTTARAGEDEATAALGLLADALRWEQRKAECESGLEKARNAVTTAHTACEAAAPRRATLDRDRAAAAIVPAWSAATEATHDLATLAERIAGEKRTLAAAVAAEERAIAALAAADAALAAVVARATELAPELARARELDVRVVDSGQQLAKAQREARERRAEADTAATERDRAAAELAKARERHAAEVAWLAAHAASEELARREADLARTLDQHADIAQQLARREAGRGLLEAGQQKALPALHRAENDLQEALEAHERATGALAEAEATLPPESRFGELSDLRERLAGIEMLAQAARTAREALETADTVLAGTRAKFAGNAAAREREAARKAGQEARLPALDEAREATRAKLALLTATLGDAAVALRAVLREGDPCPVCGADEHHLARIDRTLDEQLEPLRAELAERQREHDEAAEQVRIASSELGALARTAEYLAREQDEQVCALARASDAAKAAGEALAAAATAQGLPADPDGLPAALAAHRDRVTTELAELTRRRDAALQARHAEADARKARDIAAEVHQKAKDSLVAHSLALDEAEREITTARGEQNRLATELDRWLAPLGDWRALPDARGRLADAADSWRGHERARGELDATLPMLGARAAATASTLEAGARQAEDAATTADRAGDAHAALVESRAALLGGEATAAFEQRLAAERDHADTARRDAAQRRQDTATGRTAAETTLLSSRSQAEEAAERKAARDAALAAALAAAGFDAAEVARVAALPPGALEAEAAALAELDRELATARALEQQRHGDLAAHLAKAPPALTGPELAAAHSAATAALAAARDRRAAADAVLRQDDAVRQATATLRAELEGASARADVWLRLDKAIGDATGARFRRFAQGLTLERLLDHANARLAELKPRYTLERGLGGDMLIQVIDNDMAGEVRGLHNLSGGERFLVSLALALGLAEMSSGGGVRIESLFIDEGFGALDPASLGHAVALLETLHATGRRVGVISHVEELKERIPVKIEVMPTGRGTSSVEVVGG